MTSKTVPIYRHGRKFYVSNQEYERIRSEERQQRRSAVQHSQNLPVTKSHQTRIRTPPTYLHTPIQRTHSNPYEYKYGVLRTPHLPANSLINATNNRRESTRSSRSTFLKHYNDQDDLRLITPPITKTKKPPTIRSNSFDKVIDNQRTPLSSDSEHEVKRSFSAEITKLLSPRQQKSKQQTEVRLRQHVPTTVSGYSISPTTSFSITPNNHLHTHRSPTRLTNYVVQMKQSSLNPPSKSNSGPGSLFESGIQGSDRVYTIFGSSNQRTNFTSSSLLSRSNSDNSKNEYYHPDTTSGSFSDDTSSSFLASIQRHNTDTTHSPRAQYSTEIDDDYNQQRSSSARSTMRSQSSDGLTEKKRVRFADTEGLTLETIPDRKQLKSPINNRLLTRRQNVKISSDSPEQTRPFYDSLYQTTTKVGECKLATDV
jgi:hypothetical protein